MKKGGRFTYLQATRTGSHPIDSPAYVATVRPASPLPLDRSQNALARAAGAPPRRINGVVLGKRGVSADAAVRLRRARRQRALLARSFAKCTACSITTPQMRSRSSRSENTPMMRDASRKPSRSNSSVARRCWLWSGTYKLRKHLMRSRRRNPLRPRRAHRVARSAEPGCSSARIGARNKLSGAARTIRNVAARGLRRDQDSTGWQVNLTPLVFRSAIIRATTSGATRKTTCK